MVVSDGFVCVCVCVCVFGPFVFYVVIVRVFPLIVGLNCVIVCFVQVPGPVKPKLSAGSGGGPTAGATADAATPSSSEPAKLSHGKRRRLRKKQFLDKLENSAKAIAEDRAKDQPLAHFGTLDDLLKSMGGGSHPLASSGGSGAGTGSGRHGGGSGAASSRAAPKSHKSRRAAIGTELSRLQQVMSHPVFVADPLATLHAHLTNTVAASADAAEQKSKGKGKKKKNKKKTSAAMED